MPQVPEGLHRQAGSGRATGFTFLRRRVVPIEQFGGRHQGIPINDGQGQTTVASNGSATVQLGPQGIGTVWYPAAVTVYTTSGLNDTSVANVYAGPAGYLAPTTLLGTIPTGGAGVLAAAVPPMPVGWYLTVTWTGGKQGDIAAVNVTGSKDAWGIG